MMPYAAHKALSESASWSRCFPPYDSWGVSLNRKKVQSCSRVFGDRVSHVQPLFLPICASLCYELGAALVGVSFGGHGFEYLVEAEPSAGQHPRGSNFQWIQCLLRIWCWAPPEVGGSLIWEHHGNELLHLATCWTFLRRKNIEHFNWKTR
jgi:hypothetical protein